MSTTLKSPTLQAKRKPFTDFLKQVDFGNVEQEATDALQDIVHASTQTGKAGELTLKIKIKPIGTTGQVELEADVKAKVPQPTRGKTLMFATPDNNLQRENPRQTTLEGLRTADQEAAAQTDLRTAPAADAAQPLRAVH